MSPGIIDITSRRGPKEGRYDDLGQEAQHPDLLTSKQLHSREGWIAAVVE
jgi:hypothetical protein